MINILIDDKIYKISDRDYIDLEKLMSVKRSDAIKDKHKISAKEYEERIVLWENKKAEKLKYIKDKYKAKDILIISVYKS